MRRLSPLTGLKVLDISTVYAAPITAMLLGDMGADVLKVEHPNGDPARTHGWNREGHGLWWKVIARNKRAVTLNLSTPEGQELLRELAADADGHPPPTGPQQGHLAATEPQQGAPAATAVRG